jgi:alkanesulfonate monooxygenase SsuD/methylene tetrahydromethanopterin reductase-like flavin-dependent oxidoreductase (luciferase family)
VTRLPWGMFDWIDSRPGTATGDLYEDRFRIIAAAEDAGFVAYHLAEHHSTPLGTAPSPSVFLAALSQRTTRIQLIPSVYLLPMYAPLRLAEEICMLDHLARGRFQFGIGRGASKWEAMGFGVRPEVAKQMMEEGFEVLLGALRTGVINHRGAHYDFDQIQTVVRPFQTPNPPVWYAPGTPETVQWSARNSINILSNTTADKFAPLVDLYHATRRDGLDANPVNPHVDDPRIGLSRQVFVAPTDREAIELARAAYSAFVHNFTTLWHQNGDNGVDRIRSGFDADCERGILIVGSPGRVLDTLARDIEMSGANYLTGSFAWGGLSTEHTIRSIELFASDVAPGLTRPSTLGSLR